MEGPFQEVWKVSPELSALVPETLAEAEELAASIERAVRRETGGGVRNLSVEVDTDGIRLRGSCTSYYCKQLAQQAVMAIRSGERLTNCIVVH